MIWAEYVAQTVELRHGYILRLEKNYHLEYIDKFVHNIETCVW
jgi:hypothetical protein